MLLFQSTPPVWTETSSGRFLASPAPISIHSARVGGDTPEYRSIYSTCLFQSTPPVWAETRALLLLLDCYLKISIHSARVGGDTNHLHYLRHQLRFQSTPPVWAETPSSYDAIDSHTISIHSARVGGDWKAVSPSANWPIFQSTPPVWAETAKETIFSSLKHLYYNIFYRKKQENSM